MSLVLYRRFGIKKNGKVISGNAIYIARFTYIAWTFLPKWYL